jgi:Arc/MetJ-type ribon-helix-helix transcriptional regulator
MIISTLLKNTNLTIDKDLLAWIDENIKAKRFASRSHAVNYALSRTKSESQGARKFRSIITESVSSTEMELKTEPAKGDVQIQSVTVTNFNSQTEKISIGILIPRDGNPEWHHVGEPWTNVKLNSPRFSDKIFYLEKGERVYAKFELINLNPKTGFSKLELNVNGIYLEKSDN